MNNRLKSRVTRILQLPTVLLVLAINAGFASVGRTEDIASMVITAQRPAHGDSLRVRRDELLGNEMRTTAGLAVSITRLRVTTDLGVKLNSQRPAPQLAGAAKDKRG